MMATSQAPVHPAALFERQTKDVFIDTLDTPLALVQHTLWRHTNRNPADAQAVMDMIDEATAVLGDDTYGFTGSLIKSLDPHTRGGMGAANVQRLYGVGSLLTDTNAERVQRWGALSLMGALAMTHDPAIEAAPETVSPAVYRAQLAGSIAREVLTSLLQSEQAEPQQAAAARAFLDARPIPSEDVAIELEMLGFQRESQELVSERMSVEGASDSEMAVTGSAIGEPRNYPVVGLSPEARERMAKMDWLNDETFPDPTQLSVAGREVYRDGRQIALVVDLTIGNTELCKWRHEVETSPEGSQFWEQLAMSINRLHDKGREKRFLSGKLPTFCMATKSMGSTLRAYYVPLGKGGATGVSMYGLVAAIRTKAAQSSVFALLGKG